MKLWLSVKEYALKERISHTYKYFRKILDVAKKSLKQKRWSHTSAAHYRKRVSTTWRAQPPETRSPTLNNNNSVIISCPGNSSSLLTFKLAHAESSSLSVLTDLLYSVFSVLISSLGRTISFCFAANQLETHFTQFSSHRIWIQFYCHCT